MASILLVDDEESPRASLALLLKQAGHDVVEADGVAAAAEALAAAAFDLVITDLRMPEGDGLEVIRRTRGTRPDAEVIVLTAYAGWESAKEAMRLGPSTTSRRGGSPASCSTVSTRRWRKRRFGVRTRTSVEVLPSDPQARRFRALRVPDEVVQTVRHHQDRLMHMGARCSWYEAAVGERSSA